MEHQTIVLLFVTLFLIASIGAIFGPLAYGISSSSDIVKTRDNQQLYGKTIDAKNNDLIGVITRDPTLQKVTIDDNIDLGVNSIIVSMDNKPIQITNRELSYMSDVTEPVQKQLDDLKTQITDLQSLLAQTSAFIQTSNDTSTTVSLVDPPVDETSPGSFGNIAIASECMYTCIRGQDSPAGPLWCRVPLESFFSISLTLSLPNSFSSDKSNYLNFMKLSLLVHDPFQQTFLDGKKYWSKVDSDSRYMKRVSDHEVQLSNCPNTTYVVVLESTGMAVPPYITMADIAPQIEFGSEISVTVDPVSDSVTHTAGQMELFNVATNHSTFTSKEMGLRTLDVSVEDEKDAMNAYEEQRYYVPGYISTGNNTTFHRIFKTSGNNDPYLASDVRLTPSFLQKLTNTSENMT